MTPALCFGQTNLEGEVLTIKKFESCKTEINILYKNPVKDFKEAQKWVDQEIIIFTTQSDLTIIKFERGFIKYFTRGKDKVVYFESTKQEKGFAMSFPEFKGENIFCYPTSCYDSLSNIDMNR